MESKNRPVLNLIPEGSKITSIYLDPADTTRVIIEYFYNGEIVRVSPERLDIDDLITHDDHYIYLVEGMTYNDVYQIYSDRVGLGLLKGEDYIDNPDVIVNTGRIYLPINPLSVRYNNHTFIIDIVKPQAIFSGTEEQRNLTDLEINPFLEKTRKEMKVLTSTLIDGREITCFKENVPSMAFRNLIIQESKITDASLAAEIKSSFILSAFNDGVSDVLVMVGPNQLPYVVRFVSKEGDIPVFE